jgi:hypothetical protein
MTSFKCSINATDWQAGFNAGKAGQPNIAPANVDGLAWMSGYIEGKAAARIKSKLKSFAALANEINQEAAA